MSSLQNKCGRNPWFFIMFDPKSVIRCIVDQNPKFRFFILAFFSGFISTMYVSQQMGFGVRFPPLTVVGIAVVLAIPIGWVMMSFNALLLYWMGRLLGAKASYYHVRAAYSWATVPNIYEAVTWLVLVALHGSVFFTPLWRQTMMDSGMFSPERLIFLLQNGLGIWSFILLLNTIAEVQSFTLWRSFFNILLWWVLIIIMVMVLHVIFFNIPQQSVGAFKLSHLMFRLF